ncbi:hypothetical protein [Nitrospirillum viridazoti]|uniref:Reverse transcriptase (RNA-dependent DNA polymerase) n=1 Tax=Nitrospirillum amazonense TaxID=28077 RepID=A0A560I112_9PROT|nr:hypothetical protein [Nitrospirillum amazonense]TWB50914.1 hypothetical protein FBZ92_1225 [Nitrospirillum amazonense]
MVTGDAASGSGRTRIHFEGSGRQPREQELDASSTTAGPSLQPEAEERLLEEVLSRENMRRAYDRVMANQGAAGIDGMPVGALKPYLVEHWGRLKEDLLAG